MNNLIEIIPTSELPNLYREWAKEDPIFNKAVEFLETGQISESNLNWNRKVKERINELRKKMEWDDIYQLVKKECSLATIKQQSLVHCMQESTARNVYYRLK